MNMITLADVCDDPADVRAVLDGGVAFREVRQCDLVTDWDIVFGGDIEIAVVFCDDAQQIGTGFDTLYDDNPDVVFFVVD